MRHAVLALIAALAQPSSAASACAPPAPTRPHEMAFRFVQDSQIVFPIAVNGQPAEAWLDSGAGATVLDAAYAKRLGVVLGDPIQAQGVAGAVPDVRLAYADIRAGDLAMAGRRVVVMDLSAVARVAPRPPQVLLGRDVFDQAVVDIDFRNRRLSFTPRAEFAAPPDAPVELVPSGDLRAIPISVAGVAMPAVFDLGNAGGLLIDLDFADHYSLLAGRRLSTDLGVGADGARIETQTSLDAVKLGGVSLDGVPTVATPGLSSRAPANVGLQVLSRFHLVIDFAGDRMWMTPYADAGTRPFRKNRAGLVLTPDGPGRLVVDHVAKGSPAEAGGWKVGETVAAIEGRSIAPDYAATDAALWIYGPAGRTVTLTLAGGRKRRLRLADYF